MTSNLVRRAALGALIVVGGCITGRGAPEASAAQNDWGETLARAEAAADARRYADADRLLADFASRYPGTPGATECAYWRGILSLEPANHDGTPQIAAAFFEMYEKSGGALPHRVEAEILRNLALRLQNSGPATVAIAAPVTAASTSASSSSTADLKAKDTEIQRLKDELAKANDELERIKRRLTAPTKP
ncbi:MAG TPA: hypothetical protein VGG78_02735 [Gemmatimonadaceae bacterium]|jgi:hypothetical protein